MPQRIIRECRSRRVDVSGEKILFVENRHAVIGWDAESCSRNFFIGRLPTIRINSSIWSTKRLPVSKRGFPLGRSLVLCAPDDAAGNSIGESRNHANIFPLQIGAASLHSRPEMIGWASSCSRRICQLCRDLEASPQPGRNRLPLPSADTAQRIPRNGTPCTTIPGPEGLFRCHCHPPDYAEAAN